MKTVMDPMKNTKSDCGGDDGDDYDGVAVDHLFLNPKDTVSTYVGTARPAVGRSVFGWKPASQNLGCIWWNVRLE